MFQISDLFLTNNSKKTHMSFQSASIFNAYCYPSLQDRPSLAYYFHKFKQEEKSNATIVHQQGHASVG